LGKIAVISLTYNLDEKVPGALLELELRKHFMNNDKVARKWTLEKITILDDAEIKQPTEIEN
jgi:hypothetical protein